MIFDIILGFIASWVFIGFYLLGYWSGKKNRPKCLDQILGDGK
jgi:hypothetical protein